MTAKLIDGKAAAARLRARVAEMVTEFRSQTGRAPGLAVVLVGEHPPSAAYVRSKIKATLEAGMESFEHRLPADVSADELLALVDRLNADDTVDGILVQLPLPPHIDERVVITRLSPDKDVDGFHPENAGRLAIGLHGFVPCTPLGCLLLLQEEIGDLSGLDAIVVGRSNIVGKPMAQLLLQANCTVTIAHSRTRDLPDAVRRADIVVAAVGRPELIRGSWLKPGATVIDVGQERVEQPDGSRKLLGDVAFDEALEVAGAITPVPGGVGPMTIACLIRNTFVSAARRERFTYEKSPMIIAFLIAASSPTALDVERAFAADAQRIGQWSAFRKYADRDAVMFTPQAGWAREFLKGRKDPSRSISWRPTASYSSCDGRTAVNTGPWFGVGGHVGGTFTTVWQKSPMGWRWVYDGGGPLTGSAARKGPPAIHRAACIGKPTGAPIAPPPPLTRRKAEVARADNGRGESADKTLGWDWKVDANGKRRFRLFQWTGHRYVNVLTRQAPTR